MKILYFLGNWPKLSETFILNEIKFLTESGHDVHIFALNNPEEDYEHNEIKKMDVNVKYSNSYKQNNLLFLINNLDYKFFKSLFEQEDLVNVIMNPKKSISSILFYKEIINYIESHDIDLDLIHTHFLDNKILAANKVCSRLNIPLSCTAHAFDIFTKPKSNLQLFLDKLDFLIVPSKYNKKWFESKFDHLPRIKYIPASNDLTKFRPSKNTQENKILTVGRLVKKKGIEYALKALSDIEDDFEYHIIGSGSEEKNLKELTKKLGLKNKVKFLGNVSDKKLIEEYDKASIFLLPSIITEEGDRDAMPVVIKEALAMKTPTISTNISAIPEIIEHNKNGIIVEPKNVKELRKAILQLIKKDKKRKRLSENARKYAIENFSKDVVGKKLETTFLELIDSKKIKNS
ncbi:MAG: Glycosyltransferase, AglL family [Candidatus Methanohalarchaeum thermophilum]|uniref:Glycosyltransferase, AglL family n=1 Tax=Methanohalarchaeum thermophilum TaxID=1903181 RepID=A0A1Q6DSR8_METT1|nr:MAG: Glycosyltransferase, AglL family [Candidatus Methanohalarchaeum thermophilum]